MANLRHLSAEIGRDPALTQGPGGNTSIKESGILWVKASGAWMADAVRDDIFVPLDISTVRRRLLAGKDDCAAGASLGSSAAHASIEAPVHAILPHRVVVHVHCVETLRWAVREDGEYELGRRLDGLSWLWIPYRRPGAPLARAILDCMLADRIPDFYILQNHGVVIAAASCSDAMTLLRELRRRLAVLPRLASIVPTPDRPVQGYRWTNNAAIARLAFDPVAHTIARGGAMYPDHVVFLGETFAEASDSVDIEAALARWRLSFGVDAPYLVVPGQGVLVAEGAAPSAVAMLEGLGHVTARIAPGDAGSVRYLTADETAELTRWDAEIVRQKVSARNTSR